METYIGLFMIACGCTTIGFIAGRGMRRNNVVTTEVTNTPVTDPLDEVMRHDWLALIEPLTHKFEVGATFGSGVTFNCEGSKAMAELMTEMANSLDHARRIARKRAKQTS